MKYGDLPFQDRRLVIVASNDSKSELVSQVDWDVVREGSLPLSAAGTGVLGSTLFLFGPVGWGLGLGGLLIGPWLRKLGAKPPLPYPVFVIDRAKNEFSFPINHPIDRTVYACSEEQQNLYVPLAGFHRYMYESKLSAFHELCANLGVRRCTVVYSEDDNREAGTGASISGIPTAAGPADFDAKGSTSAHRKTEAKVFAEYPAPTRQSIETMNGWIFAEPTWNTMQKLRLERNLMQWRADFNYTDDMGITADVAAKVSRVGLQIGGTFQEIRHRSWVMEVEFWPAS